MASDVPEQVFQDTNVYTRRTPGRGNATFCSKNVKAKSQLMYVAKPLIVALETAELLTHCYFCFRTSGESGLPSYSLEQARSLKTCSGCKVVRFCDQKCQRQAWSAYHRLECKLFARLHPRILPTNVRGIVRLLKQQEAGKLAEGEWVRLLALEAHLDQLRKEGGERWEDLMLMAQATKSYSGSEQSLELILRLICILTVNAFTLTSPTLDPLGLALHPSTALLNHSCDPNAFVRFQVLPASQQPGFAEPGGISIHALRDISKNEEITLSYVDNTLPLENRRGELMERYFFRCSCNLCARGSNTTRDNLHQTNSMLSDQNGSNLLASKSLRVGRDAIALLLDIESHPGMEQTRVDDLNSIMADLAGTAVWPLYRYPWPQLRHLLLLGLLSSNRYSEALSQSAILMRAVYPVMHEQQHHPIRMAQLWVLLSICLYCLEAGIQGDGSIGEASSRFRMLGLLHCVLIEFIYRVSHEGARINGAFEDSIDQAYKTIASVSSFWPEYQQKKGTVIKATALWLDNQIHDQLRKEGVSQEIIDLSSRGGATLTPS
ncbi:SET and MYND domain-containing protein [Exophiala viscosa]|uniref:SET and MYND domain-containing protein n=1 Tax=Exophiala viscosa TaxID=2486360 RepID=A0AAN6DUF6_9EURO|nr:SET and MYND domain-containing protein [Exophiala viscosa]